MGSINQCELVFPVSLLDTVADGLAHPMVATLDLHRMAQTEYLPDHGCALRCQHVGMAFDLGFDPRLAMLCQVGQIAILAKFNGSRLGSRFEAHHPFDDSFIMIVSTLVLAFVLSLRGV
jgi:hypothetical protein